MDSKQIYNNIDNQGFDKNTSPCNTNVKLLLNNSEKTLEGKQCGNAQ